MLALRFRTRMRPRPRLQADLRWACAYCSAWTSCTKKMWTLRSVSKTFLQPHPRKSWPDVGEKLRVREKTYPDSHALIDALDAELSRTEQKLQSITSPPAGPLAS